MNSGRVTIVAEAGVNHNGSLDMALRLVDAAAKAGADVVKFQTFKADALASEAASKAEYQKRTTGIEESQRDMLRRLELSVDAHERLIAHCADRSIEFLSTPFDLQSLELLTCKLAVPILKFSSGDLTNAPLLLAAARTGRPIILSTGMATLGEIEQALGVLAFGFAATSESPGEAAFNEAYANPASRALLADRVTLLHCTSEYPTDYSNVNLRAMDTMAAAFGLPVGYSDHTLGTAVAIGAVARGAVLIEKHFTLDRKLPGPDHSASLEPVELIELVAAVRNVERALGNAAKAPAARELANRLLVRRSLVAACAIKKGEVFTPDMLTAKRPGTGLAPLAAWSLIGRTADRDYQVDDLIE